MRWYYWLLLVVLVVIAIDTIIKLYVSYKAKKARKMIRTLLDSSDIRVAEYPLLPEDSYIAGFDPYYDLTHERMLNKPILLYSEEEIQKRQLVLSLVQAVATQKESSVKLDKLITNEFSKRVGQPYVDGFIEKKEEQFEDEHNKLIKGIQTFSEKSLEDFKDPDIPAREETPEDYLKSIVFVNGKWTKKASK